MFENENSTFYKEYHELREDHYYKQVKETIGQETDFQDLLLDDTLVIQDKPKANHKTAPNTNPKVE